MWGRGRRGPRANCAKNGGIDLCGRPGVFNCRPVGSTIPTFEVPAIVSHQSRTRATRVCKHPGNQGGTCEKSALLVPSSNEPISRFCARGRARFFADMLGAARPSAEERQEYCGGHPRTVRLFATGRGYAGGCGRIEHETPDQLRLGPARMQWSHSIASPKALRMRNRLSVCCRSSENVVF
jgi:hypothetical protein